MVDSDYLGCVWIKEIVREKENEKEMEMEKLVDLTVPNGWII